MNRLVAVLLASLLGSSPVEHQGAPQLTLWQSDLQIRSLTVSEERGNLRARVVVVVESGEAIGARVEILLPVGVGIVMLGPGCRAGPDVTGISDLRARVECSLGNLPARANRELVIVTTLPPGRVARGFAAVAMSETPDPKPANNFAERVLPQRD
jgi:hypothetical protein